MSIDFWINATVFAGIYGILTLGLQLNAGLTGMLNFGQAGFMAIGAYGVGLLVVDLQMSLAMAAISGVVIAATFGVLVGLSTHRLRGDHFALATLAFAEIVRVSFQNAGFSGGNQGLIGFDTEWRNLSRQILDLLGLHAHAQLPLMLAVWVSFLALLVGMGRLRRTPWTRILLAIRADETAVAALGKSVISYKAQSLGIAAALAAIAGVFTALNLTYLYPSLFDPSSTIYGYAILLIGGLGRYRGVLWGAIAFWYLIEGTRLMDISLSASQQASFRFILVGVLLIVVSRLRPEGIFGSRIPPASQT